MNIVEVPKIYDIVYSGVSNGQLSEVWNKEAFINSLKMWMASFAGEVIHDPAKGGYLVQFLMKPMQQVDIDHMRDTIRVGLINDFVPRVNVNMIRVVPHYQERYWEIVVSVFSPDLNDNIDLTERIRSLQ
jgi:hypothetical protein